MLLMALPICANASKCSLPDFPDLPGVSITETADEEMPAPHCKVAGIIGLQTRFELLLPDDWNGKFVMGGGGGFVGSVVNLALNLGALEAGYATVGTDTGHRGHPLDGSWALNDIESIVNFGHLAVHRTATTAKALIAGYYRKQPTDNYFVGCSRGGGQALMEAQRYPEDFDAIVAGAPAYNWTGGLGASPINVMQAMYPDPQHLQRAVIGSDEQNLIEASYLAQCDALDGLEDSVLADPRRCNFSVESLLCTPGANDTCLTREQVDAAKAVYAGPVDAEGPLYYGFPFGGETSPTGWSRWFTGGLAFLEERQAERRPLPTEYPEPAVAATSHAFGLGIMKYFIYHDEEWDYSIYDFSNFRKDSRTAAGALNATRTDLSDFLSRGGKLLMYTGWSDNALSALATLGYYEQMLSDTPLGKENTRMFMMPGVEHCFGGRGASVVNWLAEIDKWAQSGTAPDELIAGHTHGRFQPTGETGLLCAYPKVPLYKGEGNPRAAVGFYCADSEDGR